MLSEIKHTSYGVSKQLGLTSWLSRSEWRRRRLLVLCYHGVSIADEHRWNPELYISPETLEQRLESLARMGCTVLPLEVAVRGLYAGTLPEHAVTLTFDDGFYDFTVKALPLLQVHGYPATAYVTTHGCGRQVPVVHLLTSYLLWKQSRPILDARGIVGMNVVYPLTSAATRARVVTEMCRSMRRQRMQPDDENGFVRDVMHRLDVDYDAAITLGLLSVMSASDLAQMPRCDVSIEMHTHRHRSPENLNEFVEEVRVNRARIEAITGRRPRHFCYPNGDYRPGYPAMLEAEGVETATTCDPALASPASSPLVLPRFVDNETITQPVFEAWVTGVASWLPRRTQNANDVH